MEPEWQQVEELEPSEIKPDIMRPTGTVAAPRSDGDSPQSATCDCPPGCVGLPCCT